MSYNQHASNLKSRMIQARFLQKSGARSKDGQRFWTAIPVRRHLSSGPAAASSRHSYLAVPLIRSRAVSGLRQWLPAHCNGCGAARFASTAPITPPIADVQPVLIQPTVTSEAFGEVFMPTSLDDVTSPGPAPVYEHLGFLKDMGLDYGWGTTAMMEWILEHVHVYAGTPWWASIGITMLIVRACLLRSYFGAADASARNQLIAQYNEPLMTRMKDAQARKDMPGVNKAMSEMKDLRARAGVKYWKIFVPFIQVPIGFGTFRLMRGMAFLPVPGLDTGGLLWMTDLTLSDPYFVLPVLTGASYYFTFKAGGEAGYSSPLANPGVRKIMLYVLPPFSGVVMCAWPGALQLTFFIQAMISMLQAAALRNPWFRERVGIQPIPKPEDTKHNAQVYSGTINRHPSSTLESEPRPKDVFGGAMADLKSAYSAAKKQKDAWQSGPKQTGRLSPGEIKHAKAYEERRKRELAQEKFERQQEIQAKQIEKEERALQKKRKQRH